MNEFLDQEWDESHFTTVYDQIYGTGWWGGQQFTTGASVKNISSISLYMKRGSTVTGDFTVSLYVASGGLPTGSAIATVTKSYTEISTSNSWHNFALDHPVQLLPDTQYCLVWEAEASSSPGYYVCVENNSGAGYTGGMYIYSTNQGVSYNTAGYDAIFKTYNTDEIADAYSEYHQNAFFNMTKYLTAVSQSFRIGSDYQLEKAQFYLKKSGSPVGTIVATIYNETGTFGTSSIPAGAPLAVSDEFDVSSLTTSYDLIDLIFSGDEQITLEKNTDYCLVLHYYDYNESTSDKVMIALDNEDLEHQGNMAAYRPLGYPIGWATYSGYDTIFYIYGENLTGSVNVTTTAKARIEIIDNEIEITSKARIERVYSATTQSKARVEVIQSKTTTSKSRIQVSNEENITARGRVNVLYEKSLEALSRVEKGYSKTNTSRARIEIISEKTISAKSRTQNNYSKTLSALASIFQELSKTVSAKARVETGSVTKSISVLARLLNGAQITVSSKASIEKNTERSITAKSRTKKTFSKSLQSKSRVNIIQLSTISAKTRLNLIQQQTTDIKARIKTFFNKTAQAKARISVIYDKSTQSKASIIIPHRNDVTAKASITYTPGDYFLLNEDGTYTLQENGFKIILDGYDYSEETISAKARIRAGANEKILSAKARIFNTIENAVTAKARVAGTETIYPLSSKARIWQLDNENTTTAKARIRGQETIYPLLSLARIQKLGEENTIRAKARITKVTSRFVRARATIKNTLLVSILARARVNRLYDYYISGKARVKQIYTSIISALSRIKKLSSTIDISAKARIHCVNEKTLSAKADIFNNVEKTISAGARIWIEGKDDVIYLNDEKRLAYNNDRVLTKDESKNLHQDDIIIMNSEKKDSDNLI